MPCPYKSMLVRSGPPLLITRAGDGTPSISAETAMTQNSSRHFAVVKINCGVAQNLVCLMPLTRKQHDVSRARLIERKFDGLLPVGFHQALGLGALHTNNGIVND